MAMNQQDNQTAMALAQAEIQSGENFAVSTGTGINPQP
jgi:Tfp pilus assembly protein PilX